MSAKLELQIITNATQAVAGFKKVDQAAGQTAEKTKSAGSKMSGAIKGLAAGYAVTKILDFGKSSVKAAEESAVANNRLVQVFKQVGDVHGKAAQEAENYATKLSNQTGVDDEAIQGAQALLVTFHSVSNAAARQGGIFNRATAAAADLAAAGYGDLNSNAIQLGKALEDPVKGMAALAKSGVTFTAAQKNAITQMEKTGNHLGAQKIVLANVESQVKGTAAATATASQKMSVAWGNAQEAIGTALLPAIQKITPVLLKVFNVIQQNSGWLVPLILGAAGFAVAVVAVSKAITLVSSAMKIAQGVIQGVKIAWALLNVVFAASPIGLIIIAIVAVIAAIVLLYVKVDWFRKAVDTALKAIVGAFQAAWKAIVAAFQWVIAFIQRWGQVFLAVLLGPFYLVFRLIMAAIKGGWSGVMKEISGWLALIGKVVGPIANVIAWPFKQAWALINAWLISPLKTAFDSVVGWITKAMSGVAKAVAKPFQVAWDWIDGFVIKPLKGIWNAIAGTINAIHISVKVPKWVPGLGGKGWDWRPPHVPTLAQGGLMTASGLVFAHAGEVISPAPAMASRSALNIEHAHFSEKIDVEVLMRQVAWQMQVQRI